MWAGRAAAVQKPHHGQAVVRIDGQEARESRGVGATVLHFAVARDTPIPHPSP